MPPSEQAAGRGHRSCGVCADDQQLFQQMRRTLTQQAAEGKKPSATASHATGAAGTGAGAAAASAGAASSASSSSAALALSATTAALSTAAPSSPSTAGPTSSSSSSSAASASPSVASVRPLPCPPDSRSLGRATWTFLHTMAAWYPEQPTPAEQSRMGTFIGHFAHLYPCSYCANHLQEHVAAHPPPTHSRRALTNFFCNYHNDVNQRLGKRQFDCGRYDERWRFGPPQGANYECIEDKQNQIDDSNEGDSE